MGPRRLTWTFSTTSPAMCSLLLPHSPTHCLREGHDDSLVTYLVPVLKRAVEQAQGDLEHPSSSYIHQEEELSEKMIPCLTKTRLLGTRAPLGYSSRTGAQRSSESQAEMLHPLRLEALEMRFNGPHTSVQTATLGESPL
jgi:hypothetical protein